MEELLFDKVLIVAVKGAYMGMILEKMEEGKKDILYRLLQYSLISGEI